MKILECKSIIKFSFRELVVEEGEQHALLPDSTVPNYHKLDLSLHVMNRATKIMHLTNTMFNNLTLVQCNVTEIYVSLVTIQQSAVNHTLRLINSNTS